MASDYGAVFWILWGLPAWVRIPSLALQTTSRDQIQLSIIPRSVNEYSKVALKAEAAVPQADSALTNKCCLLAYSLYLRDDLANFSTQPMSKFKLSTKRKEILKVHLPRSNSPSLVCFGGGET